jgi:DNA-binding PadR family transcriptional regulator
MHGYAIAKMLEQTSNGALAFRDGALYPTLHAHEAQGLITSYEQTIDGRTRKYYRITEDGHKALAAEQQQWRTWSAAVNLVLEES